MRVSTTRHCLDIDSDRSRGMRPSECSIIPLAIALGFGRAGRFAAEYAARFGESPSETRRRWVD